jgi:hypothetical protein
VITGIFTNGEMRVRSQFPVAASDVFDKIKYEEFVIGLQTIQERFLANCHFTAITLIFPFLDNVKL